MIRRYMNILYVQEIKWKGQNIKEVEDTGFKLWYTGNTSTKNGVSIVLDKSLKDGVVDIKRQVDRIILVKLLVDDLIFNVKIKRHVGAMRMCKMLLRRRKSDLGVCNWIDV
jgi:exonuclease III